MVTHQVFNQVPPLIDYDAAAIDVALGETVDRLAGGAARPGLSELGVRVGDGEIQTAARAANAVVPVLRTHDAAGHRVDEVEFHPAWHELMTVAVESGLGGAAWRSDDPHAHVRRTAGFYVWSQAEAAHGCPISMTYAAVPAVRESPDLAARYEPGLTATRYQFGLAEPTGKRGLLAGMGMTEKQGGSDVRANTTRAVAQADGTYSITGHKWFCSAPMSDLFLVLAQTDVGLACLLVPRVLPDGVRNVFRIQRLKDKLGNRANASAEVEFDGIVGWLIGEAGRGLVAILEMVAMTRLDWVTGSAAGQRAALVQAIHHARHRRAFGAPLIDQPLMEVVLADLAIEVEAAMALSLRLAAAVDADERNLLRLGLAASKFWVCKRTPAVVGEALECLGGNGYVEESVLPRLFRESPLNSIWEGSGNVMCLDVVRAVDREPTAVAAVLAEIALGAGADRRLDAAIAVLEKEIAAPSAIRARRLASSLALCLQGSLLVRFAAPAVADAFCASRLGDDWGGGPSVLGAPGAPMDVATILARAFPA